MAIQLTIPTNWNQLSFLQLKNIAYQIDCFQKIVKDNTVSVERTAQRLYIQLAKELLRGNKYNHVRIALQEIQPKTYAPFLKFVYQKVDRTKFEPFITVNNIKYYGPDQRLRNTTIEEFSFADVAFYKWKQTSNNIWLTVLCATLYREAATNPTEVDTRTPFVKLAVDKRADKFLKLDYKTKLAIAYTYEGCRNHIADSFPYIFPKPIETEETNQQTKKAQKYVSFGEIILDKIQGDPSKLEQTNQVNTYSFLSIYNKDIKDLPKK